MLRNVLFSTKYRLFYMFFVFCLNTFFINHALKFKYQPGHLKVEVFFWRHSCCNNSKNCVSDAIRSKVSCVVLCKYDYRKLYWRTVHLTTRWNSNVFTSQPSLVNFYYALFALSTSKIFMGCGTECIKSSSANAILVHTGPQFLFCAQIKL
jgi:hypothetical protein